MSASPSPHAPPPLRLTPIRLAFSCATAEADKEGAKLRREALRVAREEARRAEEEARRHAEAAVEEIQQTLTEIERARSSLDADVMLDTGIEAPG